nr:phage tail protein [Chimaeribacter californicus]
MPVGDCPVGAPVPWPGAAAPTGWLKCNGASFSANTYPELAKAYPSLKLPDLRGEFIRGWDDGRGADSGRALLSAQSDAVGLNYGSTNVPKTIVVNIPRTSSGTDAMDGLEVGVGFADNGATSVSRLTAKTANETRPRNVAFNYIVRAA